MQRKSVILHTDIGGDIDDVWAFIMLLRQTEILNLKMVLTDTGDTFARAALCAKLLDGTDYPRPLLAAGIRKSTKPITHHAWLDGYDPGLYPGSFRSDGTEALIEEVRSAAEPVTLISIGPPPSLARALELAPDIAEKVDFVGMYGSIRRKYDGSAGCVREYNAFYDVAATQRVFRAPWRSFLLTPIDTCAAVVLDGELFQRIAQSPDPLLRKLMECYRCFLRFKGEPAEHLTRSTLLCDTVGIHLASSQAFLRMEMMNLRVDDAGLTVQDNSRGMPINTAIEWTDLQGFKAFLVETLTGTGR